MLDKILDRSYLVDSSLACPYGPSGVGYEIIQKVRRGGSLGCGWGRTVRGGGWAGEERLGQGRARAAG